MIARISGRLVEKQAGRIVVDVGGVGYEVFIPLSTYYELGEEESRVSLHVYTHVKEDALSLFGFLSPREKALFTHLIQISGIGPKLGVTILSGLPADEFAEAVVRGDLVRLNSIPGVGKKTAERIVLELKSKLAKLMPEAEAAGPTGATGAVQNDVVSALVNLGYAKNVADKAVSRAARDGVQEFEPLLKAALKKISGG